MSKLTLNLGSGDRTYSEYPDGHRCINLDNNDKWEKVDVFSDVRSLPFPKHSFDYVLASDIIEHFPLADTENLLIEWARVLKVEGHLEIRTPNLAWAAWYYHQHGDAEFVSWHLYGGQDYPSNLHRVIFDKLWLTKIARKFYLFQVGQDGYREDGSNFILTLTKKKEYKNG